MKLASTAAKLAWAFVDVVVDDAALVHKSHWVDGFTISEIEKWRASGGRDEW